MLLTLERGEKRIGVMYRPDTDELYYALSGSPYRGYPFLELEAKGVQGILTLKDVVAQGDILVKKRGGAVIYQPETTGTSEEKEKEMDTTNPKDRIGQTKPPVSAIPPVSILHLGKAMQDGKEKYGHMNWRETNVRSDVYYNAIMRHLLQWFDGEDKAEDSGCHHLAHIMACCAILLDADAYGSLIDDRPTADKSATRYIQENTKT